MKRRFLAIILVVILSIGGMLVLGEFGLATISSLRAYVGGESLYAQGQQGATISLLQYAQTRDQGYYDEFLEHIRIPMGDQKARLALDKANPDVRIAADGFREGGNHPKDISSMIDVFLTFRNFDLVDKAVNLWAKADKKIVQLKTIGENLHLLIQSKNASSEEIDQITAQVLFLSQELSTLTTDFSHALGEASRWAKGLFARILFGFSLLSLITCLLAFWFVGKLVSEMQENARQLEVRDWITSGLVSLNEKIANVSGLSRLSSEVISHICEHIGAGVGAIYIADEEENSLKMTAGYAFEKRKGLTNRFEHGDGLVGQAALEKKYILMTGCPDDYIRINSGLGNATPKNIIAYPFVQADKVYGVIEVGSFHEFDDREIEFLASASEIIANAINVSNARRKEAVLLERTQQQAEELTTQQEELRATNEELEEYGKTLRESEQQLQAQQEELRVTNEELTEQAQNLEEQKEEIEKKNRELNAIRLAAEEKSQQLEITGKYKSEFLANMSHELRTPLNSVLLLSRLLSENKGGNLTEKQMEFAQTIHSSGSDLLTLINEVLDLSKIEAGKMDLNIESLTLSRFAEKLQRTYEKIADEKGLDFIVDIHPDIPAVIHTDSQRLEQVIKNFISNAIKFTEKGTITLAIGRTKNSVSFSKKEMVPEQTIAFSVSDTGIGIEKDKQQLVFEAFQQADGSTSRKYGGTGLGLSISRELATCLGGEIQLESEKGKGSTFTFYLPEGISDNAVAPEKTVKTASDDKKPEATTAAAPAHEPLSKTRQIEDIRDDRNDLTAGDRSLLIIEDDPVFLKTLKDLAQEKGFKTIVAGDGETGLHLADFYQPSAIILDVKLPGIDGWKVMTRLKETSGTRHIPVHFISGVEKADEAARMGAVGYLLKPVSLSQINQAFAMIENIVDARVKKLMVVEGDAAESARIKQLLNEKDLSIEIISSGNAAIRRLKEEAVHCIILGLRLPDMDGIEFIGKIRSDEAISHIPVIVYTGKELTSEERVFLDSYSERVITKDSKSLERLFDETAMFLHRVEANLPEDKRRMLDLVHDKEAIFKDKKVLIVDDDMRNVYALTSILEDKGLRVIMAKDGREGVSRVMENHDLDLVLMDIMMPEMDGYECMGKIREMDEFKRLPIIALTAKAMRGDRAKCIEAGANDYLSKPVDSEKLLSMLRVWLYR